MENKNMEMLNQECGECPIWLAAYECDELSTMDKILTACRQTGCEV